MLVLPLAKLVVAARRASLAPRVELHELVIVVIAMTLYF
jgi:hypothetical protein